MLGEVAQGCCDKAFKFLSQARAAYNRHQLPGSPEKDEVAARMFKAAGAEVGSREEVLSLGLCLIGAPLQKRLGLSLLSLRTAALPAISTRLAYRISGSWVSVLLYRRCLSSIVEDLFALGSRYEKDGDSYVVPLTRKVAQELTFLSVLSPLMSSDVSAPFLQEIFATDASMDKGAFVVTSTSEEVSKTLWLEADKKGDYTMLESGFRVCRKHVGDYDSEEENAFSDDEPSRQCIERPPSFEFDFVEICGGVGSVSKEMSLLGFVVAPNLDLSYMVCWTSW